MTVRAADQFGAIRSRMVEIRYGARTCPIPARPTLVADCLRHGERCPEACPLRGDWIGPQT